MTKAEKVMMKEIHTYGAILSLDDEHTRKLAQMIDELMRKQNEDPS